VAKICEYDHWLSNLKFGLKKWLRRLTEGLEPGRFRFCIEGSLTPTSGYAFQASTCFASRIARLSGMWDEWPDEIQKACINYICSFQNKDGYFFDPWLWRNGEPFWKSTAKLILGKYSWNEAKEVKLRSLRAETRQSASTLILLGAKPPFPLPIEASNPLAIEGYIEKLKWNEPWVAGSHLSHLMFMLSINKIYGYHNEFYEDCVGTILSFLEGIHDEKTGTWFTGKPPDAMKINGAMKILSGLQWFNLTYPDLTSLVDFALEQPFEEDGCGFLNRLYVVQQALKGAPEGYRKNDIQKLALETIELVKKFQKADGGFSFFINRSQPLYYGARVSRGLPVGDLHGSAMLVWAISIALDLLGEVAPEGAKKWRIHKP